MVFYKIKEILRYRIDQEKILKTGKLDLSNIQNASKDRMGQEFMEFEPEIAEMYWLEEIDLSNNRIAFLEFILNLKQLRILRLFDNSIVDFEGFERCKSLEVLEISECVISVYKNHFKWRLLMPLLIGVKMTAMNTTQTERFHLAESSRV